MRKVTFYSQIAAVNVKEPHYVISISEPEHVVGFTQPHLEILRLYFHDIEQHCADHSLFSAREARTILDWIKKVPDGETVIVHCHAGVSRSAAVAKYLNDHEGFFLLLDWPCSGDISGYNTHVYGLLRWLGSDKAVNAAALLLDEDHASIRNTW